MHKLCDCPLQLSVILIGLLAGCLGPKEDPRKSPDRHVEANESLKNELRAYESFNKAEPFYQAGLAGADSAIFYYGQLLKEDLTPDQQLLVFNRIGYWKYLQQKYSDSYAQFRNAIALFKLISPDHLHMEGMACYYAGLIQSEFNQSDSAFYYFNECRELFRKTGDPDNLFSYMCMEGIANEYNWGLKDYASAEKYYTRAERMLETGRINGIDPYRFRLFYSISSTYRQKKEFDKAIVYAVRAQYLADSLTLPEPMEISRALLSNIYRDQNLWELARSLNLQAIEINKSGAGAPIDLATHFNNQSFILINLRQYDEAMAYCRKTLEVLDKIVMDKGFDTGLFNDPATHADLVRQITVADDPGLLLLVLEQLGVCYDFSGTIYSETGNPGQAYRDYTESLRLRRIRYGNYHKRVSQINHLIGGLFLQTNLPDSALFYYQQSLMAGSAGFNNTDPFTNPSVEQIEDNIELIDVLQDKASLLKLVHGKDPRNTTTLRASLECYLVCDSLIDFVWNSYTNEDSRLYLENIVHPVYEEAIETACQLYQNDSSVMIREHIYHFLESSRYRFLSDNLTCLQSYARAKVPGNLIARLRETDFYINYFTRQKTEIPGEFNYYNTKLHERIRQKDLLMDSIAVAYPEVAVTRNLLKTVTFDALNNHLQKNNDVLLQFYSAEKYFLILSTNGKIHNIRKVEKDSLLLHSIRTMLELPDSDPLSRQDYIRYVSHSYNLYRNLLKPDLDLYGDHPGSKLIIVPDGSLNRISFDALILSLPDTSYVNYRTPDYLVRHYSVSYAFSSGMVAAERQLVKTRTRNKVLGLSYGVAGGPSGSFASLTGSDLELDAVRRLFPGRYYKGRQATESNFKKYASDYQIIHLALHGKAGLGSHDSTMLVFQKVPGGQDDGFLLMDELYSLNLKARLVVLSSCESGTGKTFRGEGVYSMARAFAQAGCPSLITTLWQIPDLYTVPLIEGLYAGVREKQSPDQALRESKVDYLDQADPHGSHPRFWASLISLGKF